ncbi:MAG: SRPBCC family protein [Bdellovibrionales bacterium]|nr:SRPBCC family protein [Bdellovibrionales bacterium]
MKKKFAVALGILFIAIVALGFVAPKDFHVEREVIIERPKDLVFQQLKLLRNHDQWSPWSKRDPQMKKEFRGEDGTVGFISSWSGNDEVGVGEQEITKVVEGERIETELRFKEPMEDVSQAYLVTEALGENQTKVRWGMKDTMSFPANVFCLIMNMQAKLGNDFEDGLAQLKTVIEGT